MRSILLAISLLTLTSEPGAQPCARSMAAQEAAIEPRPAPADQLIQRLEKYWRIDEQGLFRLKAMPTDELGLSDFLGSDEEMFPFPVFEDGRIHIQQLSRVGTTLDSFLSAQDSIDASSQLFAAPQIVKRFYSVLSAPSLPAGAGLASHPRAHLSCRTETHRNDQATVTGQDWSRQHLSSRVVPVKLALACSSSFVAAASSSAGLKDPLSMDGRTPPKAPNLADAKQLAREIIQELEPIFLRDFGVQLELIWSDQMVFVDPSRDPFREGTLEELMERTHEVLRDYWEAKPEEGARPTEVFDVGHLLHVGLESGQAQFQSVGSEDQKGMGVTSGAFGRYSTQEQLRSFTVDYLAHELGHQLGASHTFNGTAGGCGGEQRSASTAYEPGSGTTLMGYAGICGADDMADRSTPHFHLASAWEVRSNLDRWRPDSGSPRDRPQVWPGSNFGTIPKGTPFYVESWTATGSQETCPVFVDQWDLGDANGLTAPSVAYGPLVGSSKELLAPSTGAGVRFCTPSLETLLGLEMPRPLATRLPDLGRQIRFRLSARDGQGGIGMAEVTYEVIQDAGPFRVHHIAGPQSDQLEVRWDVAGTNRPPISADFVRLELHLGRTWDPEDPTRLGWTYACPEVFPNTGRATVALPAIPRLDPAARVLIWAVDRPFFAVSQRPFTVVARGSGPTPSPAPPGSPAFLLDSPQ